MKILLKKELESMNHQLDLFLKQCAEKHGIPSNTLYEMNLALGELITNIINYGEGKDTSIHLDCEIKKGEATFFLKDKGLAFNPLEYKCQDLSAKLEDRPIGGLGIAIAKKSVDAMFYERKNETNVLKIVKNFKPTKE